MPRQCSGSNWSHGDILVSGLVCLDSAVAWVQFPALTELFFLTIWLWSRPSFIKKLLEISRIVRMAARKETGHLASLSHDREYVKAPVSSSVELMGLAVNIKLTSILEVSIQ